MMEAQTQRRSATMAEPISLWAIDPMHSSVGFAVRHLMVSTVRGRFGAVRGMIALDERDLANSAVAVLIEAASIDTREERRDAHLRSADFLSVARFPTIEFCSTRVEPRRGDTFRVTGELTLHGVTREVVLNAERTGRGPSQFGGEAIGFAATATIDRRDFGLTWNAAIEAGGVVVGDEVKITIDVQAMRQE